MPDTDASPDIRCDIRNVKLLPTSRTAPKIGARFDADVWNPGGPMSKDWQAVADVISARLLELDMTQSELAHRADVALETVRELHRNLKSRRRSPRTLAALSQALDWPDDHLLNVAEGDSAGKPSATDDRVLVELASIREVLAAIAARLDSIERRLPDDASRS